jgi:hypothetical protein
MATAGVVEEASVVVVTAGVEEASVADTPEAKLVLAADTPGAEAPRAKVA